MLNVIALIISATALILADGFIALFFGELWVVALAAMVYFSLLLSFATGNFWIYSLLLSMNAIYVFLYFTLWKKPENHRREAEPEEVAIMTLISKGLADPDAIAERMNVYPGRVREIVYRLRQSGYVGIRDGKLVLTEEGKKFLNSQGI